MKLFKAEDFSENFIETPFITSIEERELLADIANFKLNQWLDAVPTVYGKHPFPMNYIGNWANKPTELDTHSAKLVCIQELKKECKHEPIVSLGLVIDNNDYHYKAICKHCNAELVAEWRAK